MNGEYDLVIIGTGAAGVAAATAAVHLGASRVAIVERGPLWGTCVNTGCIPSKFLLTLAGYDYYRGHGHPGVRMQSRFDLGQALAEKNALQEHLREKKRGTLFDRLGVELIEGEARFLSTHTMQVGDRKLASKRFIIATGSTPAIPQVEGIGSVPFMTSADALSPDHIPATLIVIGGRALGLEFAQLYTHLGTRVTILQRSPRILPDEEPEIADLMARYLAQEGIEILTGVDIKRVEQMGDSVSVVAGIRGEQQVVTADRLLLATGRTPNTQELNCSVAAVDVNRNGAIVVDTMLGTSAPHIWAAGDVIGEPMLETAARYGGEIAASNALRDLKRSYNSALLPHGIFTTPQVAGVGMTEEKAQKAGLNPVSHSIRTDSMAKFSIDGDTRGMVKIVADKRSRRILGVHVCAPLATEMIQEGVIAVTRYLTADDLAELPHVFPTATEALAVCARGLLAHTGDCSG
ncbi:mercury(II) reductase [Methanoregula sp.]|uniref:mercury(II) reductase n=1 Tax=Methanoregula sp. TaxID=2052170 RepID=UPI002CF329E8|nr:mercury(II) reductase [Methanoregula sp.]HVP96065.1 mercury(II) reductase [Methanoregula sp.]